MVGEICGHGQRAVGDGFCHRNTELLGAQGHCLHLRDQMVMFGETLINFVPEAATKAFFIHSNCTCTHMVELLLVKSGGFVKLTNCM
uniref:Uncharacterized protein n=1 Tax=Zea mays TaxID=4577 RepID=A0A804RBE8_MAIZE